MMITVRVKPNAREEKIIKEDDIYKVWVTVPAKDGKANQALCKLLAKHFKVPFLRISITRGHTSSQKIITIE